MIQGATRSRTAKAAATFISALVLFSPSMSHAEIAARGYLRYLQTLLLPDTTSNWLLGTTLNNRIDFGYYPTEELEFVLGWRNRVFVGELVEDFPSYDSIVTDDPGLFRLSATIADGTSYLIHTMLDRFYAAVALEQWYIRAGRMRVNWGLNLVWNPNDLFNAFSPLDFDYEERPGMDGAQVLFYPGPLSSAQLVYEAGDDFDKMSIVALLRANRWEYDFQILGGIARSDVVIGGGWSGALGGAAFRGELTYFHPRSQLSEPEGQVVASVSSDYLFDNGFYLHGSLLFDSDGTTEPTGRDFAFRSGTIPAKELTPALGSIFAEIRYPFTPLFSGDLSAIVNPFDGSFVLIPSLTYSVTPALELLLLSQAFVGQDGSEFGDIGVFLFGRLQWTF